MPACPFASRGPQGSSPNAANDGLLMMISARLMAWYASRHRREHWMSWIGGTEEIARARQEIG